MLKTFRNIIHNTKYKMHMTSKKFSLMDFFDKESNWGKSKVVSGKPWRIEELRIKSNSDLHKLWYILLKERNMLMTMEEVHHNAKLHMISPERLEKVEESMENILLIVEERDRAVTQLEHSEYVEGPDEVYKIDCVGREVLMDKQEHLEPQTSLEDENMFSEKTVELLRLKRQKEIKDKNDKRFWKQYIKEQDRYDREIIKNLNNGK